MELELHTSLINIGLGFLEGFALIISPCILPILPIILAGSLESGKKRPIGIIVGFITTFALFTFFARKLVQISGIDLNLIRNISFVLLLLFGIIMLSDYLTEKFNQITARLANLGTKLSGPQYTQGGFWSGLIFGALIGVIWTPCAGPILAAVIVQTVIQKTTFASFLTVLAFGVGAAIPMLVIALLGRKIMAKFGLFRSQARIFRKILGAIIIAGVAYMFFGNSLTPSAQNAEKKAEKKVENKTEIHPISSTMTLTNGLSNPYPAPQITGITDWINSKPLTLNQLKGKVVLIDFWAYSCINCIRTLPYLKDWYSKYHDQGFVIIGVHSPEFDFERDFNNVKHAVKQDGIKYPVALDNNFSTWQNYNNQYWPAHYIIDKNGEVVYQHFGEGEYDVTENNIRFLLGIKKPMPAAPTEEAVSERQTPETYLGYARADNFRSPEAIVKDLIGQYSYPKVLPEDGWSLRGAWVIASQKITSKQPNAAIKIHFHAGKVFAVMGSASNKPIHVKLLLNGELVEDEKGGDVQNSAVTVTHHTLYHLIKLKHPGSGILELTATEPGLEVYTFTFGE